MIERITILGGHGKVDMPETIERIDMQMGDVVSIVGPTGSGKTTLINDIELFANGDTPTGRKILIDGERPPAIYRDNPSCNPIALITQHTNFLSDLPVYTFLSTHAGIRCEDKLHVHELIERTIDFANQLTGEPIIVTSRMTELSGGQTRALLIADATIICNTPIVLLDEVENAGIHRTRAIELMREYQKIFIFVTHDPRIALLSDYRIAMRSGCITKVIHTSAQEREFAATVNSLDDALAHLRDSIRAGKELGSADMESLRMFAEKAGVMAK
jgi:ABC-type lipoprotein export system ATPase subunit